MKFQNINGTAVLITWDQVPSTREAMRGKVMGYMVSTLILEKIQPAFKVWPLSCKV